MNDKLFIAKAKALAAKGKFNSKPGVNVGSIIVKNQKIIGQGFYEGFGGPHAEINAINDVKKKYKKNFLSQLSGSEIYVTLEPCSKKGKTGACVDELKKYDFKRIIIGSRDPTQRGLDNLRNAGYEVTSLNDRRCIDLNLGFLHKAKFNKPFVRAKIAMSADHKSVFLTKKRKWITGIPARNDVQCLRAESDIVLTGAGTINEDLPSMNVRLKKIVSSKAFDQPKRYVFSKDLALDWNAPFFNLPGQKVVVTSKRSLPKSASNIKNLSLLNCKRKGLYLDPKNFIEKISRFQINNILLESGPNLLGSFGDSNLIDEFIFYISPEKLGSQAEYFYKGKNKINFFDNKQFDIVEETQIGKDKKIVLRKK
tara:strand:- start:91 stop:1191 length:1101 start_codon:yes stop_codon:yes gene_type:complete